jgi:spermidine/putrescine transport system ATP-binding protein
MNAMIEIAALTKRFGAVTAVDNVSFDVREGELLTLLGPSGCGKTTLLRLLSGFEHPTSGAIRIAGADVTSLPPNRRDVNQVFQSYALFPHLTVRENIAFGLKMQRLPRGEIDRSVREVLALVALGGMEDRHPHELSGGQRQRVALARAIVPSPRILLLDEPLSALDAKLRRSMQLEIKRLQKQLGLTTILVTHDQDEALALSDRIAVMEAGRIAQLDTPERIYRSPADAFVAEFIGESNVFRAEVVGRVESVDGGHASLRLKVAEGLFFEAKESAGAIGLRAGQSCRISVRPESISVRGVVPPGVESGNTFAARLIEKIFLGSTVRAVVEVVSPDDPSAKLQFTIFQPATSFLASADIGADLVCAYGPEIIIVLR